MANLLPKRTIANPATAAEIAITNRNVANIYKGLEYGSYAIGGLGFVKGGISLLRGGIKKISTLGKMHPIEAKQAIRKAIGVPKRKWTLYSGSVKGEKYPTSLKGAKYDKWFTDKKDYAIRYTMPYGVVSKIKLDKLPKVLDDRKAYSQAWINIANKGGGELRKVTLNQKEMLAAHLEKGIPRAKVFLLGNQSKMFGNKQIWEQGFHGPLSKSLLNKSVKIPLKKISMDTEKIKQTHYLMRGGWRKTGY